MSKVSPLKQSIPPSESAHQLALAFQKFSEETRRLESSYSSLKNQYATINQKLQEKIQELHATSQYLNSILLHMQQGLLFIDAHGTICTYNPVAASLLLIPEINVTGSLFWEHFPDELFGFSLKKALTEQVFPELTSLKLHERSIEVSTTFIHEGPEQQRGVILILRDVTELCRLQGIALRNDRLQELGEMAASVAHEIRNPLGGIRGFVSLLQRDLQEQPEQSRMCQQIANGAETINRLITNVLNYARPLKLHCRPTQPERLASQVYHGILHDPSLGKTHPIHLHLQEKMEEIYVDEPLLQNALLNLIINSLQASVEGSPITLSVKQTAQETSFSVEDQGEGISEGDLEKIFSPFFTTKHYGNGFGLSEAHKTVLAHGGSMEAHSSPGVLTRITITLPKTSKQKEARS